MAPWKWLFFESERFAPDPQRSESWNRGAYLATALAHCGECHTPRNALGALDTSLWYAGTKDGPEGELAPNITPHGATGIGRWSAECYLLWSLGRRDVWPAGDLALQVGWQWLAGLEDRPGEAALRAVADRWRPRRTAAALLIWHYYLAEQPRRRRPG